MTAATAWIFAAFLAALAVCLVMGWSATWAIVLGLALFFLLGMHRGLRPMELWKLAWEKGKQAIVILKILILIGVITGLWRASGTIAYCVYYGVQMIAPDLFVLLAFALTAVLSYALGTSFGVASTAGVIFMALARSGGVNEAVAAGAILSGVYFGDRCSPVSSSANLVAVVTGTSLYRNVRRMFVTALPAMGLILALYLLLSFQNPIAQVDRSVLEALESNFTMTLAALLPAAVILLLPLFRVPITWALTASLAAAAVVGWLVQGFSPLELLQIGIFGYQPEQEALSAVMAGGGVMSMFSTYITVLCTSLYSGILEGLHVLDPLEERLWRGTARFGRLPVMLVTSILCSMLFCNQSVVVLMTEQLLRRAYPSREELALDIENTGITLAGLVPWSIACSVPLSMMGAGYDALPYAFLLWLIPLCYLPCKRWFYPEERAKKEKKEKEK